MDGSVSHLPITNHVRLEVMPTGQLAMEVGDLDAVVIFTPSHARRVATRIRTLLCGDDLSDLVAERRRIDDAIAYKRRQRRAPLAHLDKRRATRKGGPS